MWPWPIVKVAFKVMHISTINILQTMTDWTCKHCYCQYIESCLLALDWYIYIWPWPMLKVDVNIICKWIANNFKNCVTLHFAICSIYVSISCYIGLSLSPIYLSTDADNRSDNCTENLRNFLCIFFSSQIIEEIFAEILWPPYKCDESSAHPRTPRLCNVHACPFLRATGACHSHPATRLHFSVNYSRPEPNLFA